MQVIVCDTHDQGADLVSDLILKELAKKPNLVLGLATGSTPLDVYKRLIRAHREEDADFSRVHSFNLDEYIGLAPDHPQSYSLFMRTHLFDEINVPPENIHFPPREGPQLLEKCEQYDEAIRSLGGIDIQVLGVGTNGHIGFNEPTSSLASFTRIKTLTEKTLRDNSRFYAEDEEQPILATTMGIGSILEAKKIVLQAFGAKKAEAILQIVEGPVSSFWPGSALQLHAATTLYLDAESASKLQMIDYYRKTRACALDLEERGVL